MTALQNSVEVVLILYDESSWRSATLPHEREAIDALRTTLAADVQQTAKTEEELVGYLRMSAHLACCAAGKISLDEAIPEIAAALFAYGVVPRAVSGDVDENDLSAFIFSRIQTCQVIFPPDQISFATSLTSAIVEYLTVRPATDTETT